MAFWHGRILPADLLLPPPRHRRHHQRELRRRVDRRHHRALRLRHGARLDVARRAQGAAAADARHGGGQAGRRSRSTARAVRRASRSPAPSGWRRRPAIRCCRFTSRPTVTGRCDSWDRTQIPEAVRRPWRSRSASRSRCRRTPTTTAIEQARLLLEARLTSARGRALLTRHVVAQAVPGLLHHAIGLPIAEEAAGRSLRVQRRQPDDGVGALFDRPRRVAAAHVGAHPARARAVDEDAGALRRRRELAGEARSARSSTSNRPARTCPSTSS